MAATIDDLPGTAAAARGGAPLVTVIMPVRDGMPFLPATIASVASQTHTRLQCIAIDDGSSDASPVVLAAARGWSVLKTPGGGPNPARQLALRQAEGEFVAFLDQDDIWHRDHVAQCVATLRRNPAAAAVVAPREAFWHDSQLRLGRAVNHAPSLDPWAVFPITVIDTPSMVLMRTHRVRDEGGWPDDRVLGSDPLLWWRLSTNAPLAVSACRSVGVRRSARSLSARQRRWPLEYTRQLQRAMRDALPHANAHLRSNVQTRAERLMDALILLLETLLDGGSLLAPARQVEHALGDATTAATIAAIGFLGWLVAPQLREEMDEQRRDLEAPDGEHRDLVRSLLLEWPRDAQRTRSAVRRMVAASASPARITAVLRAQPFRREPWRAALESAAFHAARRLGRIDDPLGLPIGIASRGPAAEVTP